MQSTIQMYSSCGFSISVLSSKLLTHDLRNASYFTASYDFMKLCKLVGNDLENNRECLAIT